MPGKELCERKSEILFNIEIIEKILFNAAGKVIEKKYFAKKLVMEMREIEFEVIK